MSEHTPTTDEVRDYIRAADRVTAHMFSADSADAVEAFDRWLAAHDAEVLRAAAVELEDSIHHLDPAHPSELSFINCTRIDSQLLRERADRIAGVLVKQEGPHEGHKIIELPTYASSLIRRRCGTCDVELEPREAADA